MPVRKPQALSRNLIDKRCRDLGSTVDPNISVADIVPVNDDNIGSVCRRKERRRSEKDR